MCVVGTKLFSDASKCGQCPELNPGCCHTSKRSNTRRKVGPERDSNHGPDSRGSVPLPTEPSAPLVTTEMKRIIVPVTHMRRVAAPAVATFRTTSSYKRRDADGSVGRGTDPRLYGPWIESRSGLTFNLSSPPSSCSLTKA